MKARGFTLIELLVVISIISLLSSVVLSSLNSARSQSRDSKRIAEIRQMQKVLEMYYQDNGQYPHGGWFYSYNSNWQTSNLATSLDPYMPELPIDPVNESTPTPMTGGLAYAYYADNVYEAPFGSTIAQGYMIVFTLENQNNALESIDGVERCTNNYSQYQYNYGGNDGYIITLGVDCIE